MRETIVAYAMEEAPENQVSPLPRIHDDCQERAPTGVVPRQQLREERVVVCQRLAGCRRIRGSVTGGGQVGHLGGRLCGLVLDILSDGAWNEGEDLASGTAGHRNIRNG